MIFVGADISFTSPSITISDGKKFLCLFVSSKGKHENFDRTIDNFKFVNLIGNDIHKYKGLDTDGVDRFKRISHINEEFMKYITTFYKNSCDIKCVIEACVFGAGSQGESKLYENSSVFKYLFTKQFGYDKITEVNAKTLKKAVCRNGNATKWEMFCQMQSEFQDIDFLTILKNEAGRGSIISPIEDIIDSLAFCLVASDYKFKNVEITKDVIRLLYNN